MSDKDDSQRPPKLSREETRAKLKSFLKGGDSDDVQSVLVHTLMERGDKMAGSDACDHKGHKVHECPHNQIDKPGS